MAAEHGGGEPQLPQRLRELHPETVLFLDRLNSTERDSLIYFANLSEKKRERLTRFLGLAEDEFEAGFKVVELWTRLGWMGITAMKIILTVAGLLLAINQILTWWGPKTPGG